MFEVDTRNITEISDILPLTSLTPTTHVILIIYNVFVVLVGLLGNLVVLYSSLQHQAIKLDPVSLMFVHTLAVSDILLTLTMFLPMLVTLLWRRWVLGPGLCYLVAFLATPPLINEVLTILSISVYRIWAIRRTVGPSNQTTLTLGVRILTLLQVLLSCLCSGYLVISGCYAYFNPKDLLCWPSIGIVADDKQMFVSYYTIAVIAIPMVLTTILNISIAVFVKCNTIKNDSAPMRRMLLTLSAVVWVFLGSYSCVIVNLVLGFVHTFETQQAPWFDLLMVYFLSINVVLNPVVYVLTNRRFRQFILSRLCGTVQAISSNGSAT